MGKTPIGFFIILSIVSLTNIANAQYSGDYEYSRETTWGVTKATNSGLIGGFIFKHARELKEGHFHGGMVEIVNSIPTCE